MTLIAGIRGIRKSYIVADSRATISYPDGTTEIKDNAQKWMHFNQFSTIAVAGDAQLGAFIAKYMASMSSEHQSFAVTKSNFDVYLENAAVQFNQFTGRFTSCAILLVGYDVTQKDDLDAARLGDVMAAGVKKHGEGVSVEQNIDHEIIEAMSNALHANGGLSRGDRVEVDLSRSVVVGYKVSITDKGVVIEEDHADTFESLFYGADSAYNKVEVPVETVSDIYFRDTAGRTSRDVLLLDTIDLINFYKHTINDRKYTGVGGGIFPVMMTDTGGIFYSDELVRQSILDGSRETMRDTKVIDGKLHYKEGDGQYMPYESLIDIADNLTAKQYKLDYLVTY